MKRDLFTMPLPLDLEPMPAAPTLIPHKWPFPGTTPEDSARIAVSMSGAFADAIAATIKRNVGKGVLVDSQIKALLPQDWLDLLGRWACRKLSQRDGEQRGIEVAHISHDDGGFHCEYRAKELN
jgi:hypothetical protein